MQDLERLKRQLSSAKSSIDFYENLYSDLQINSIDDKSDFREDVPRIEKEELLNYYKEGNFELGSSNIPEAVLARPTSGTTSEMACYYRTKDEIESHCLRVGKATNHFFETGENKDRVLVAATFSLSPILTRQFMEMGCMVTSASPFDLERTVEVFRTMECNTLVCSPPVALKIAEKLKEKNYEGLEKFYFVSSGLSSAAESRLMELYPEAEVMLQYGLAETGILMEQCKEIRGTNSYHLFDESPFYYEFVTEEGEEARPGEIGEIVVTKFHEKTPLIRYGVGDLFEVKEKCSCGSRIYRFVGRKEDKFKIQGVTVFKDRIENALKPVEENIKQYQVLIDEKKSEDLPKPVIRLKMELKDDSSDSLEQIKESFSSNFQVAEDYNWSKGVEMGIFAPVEIKSIIFDKRKFRKIKDLRYE